jgi:hypothetical protein
MEGIYDNYIVKRQIINSGYGIKLFSQPTHSPNEEYSLCVLC